MDRRTFLAGWSGATVVTIAGCIESDDDEPTTPDQEAETTEQDRQESIESDPNDVLAELRDALGDETPDRFRELLHSDSPARQQLEEFEPGSGDTLETAAVLSEPVEEHELIEEGDTAAAICGRNRDGEPIARFDFRAEDGEWRLWDAVHARVGEYPDDPEAFEVCGKLVIRIHRLPEPARQEAETALEDGRYETDEEPYLSNLLDPEESYLALEEDNGRTEYRLHVEQDGETTILELEETIASWGEAPLTVYNNTDESVTVDIRVERNRTEETVVEETLTIDPDADAETEAFDREFGSYTATIETDELDEEIGWGEGENELPLRGLTVTPDGIGIEPGPMLEPINCQDVWEEPVEFTEDCEPIED